MEFSGVQVTRLLLALAAITLMAQQPPRPDGISCTVEVLAAPHGQSQHGPMVAGQAYRAEVVIDDDVRSYVDAVGRTHLTGRKRK